MSPELGCLLAEFPAAAAGAFHHVVGALPTNPGFSRRAWACFKCSSTSANSLAILPFSSATSTNPAKGRWRPMPPATTETACSGRGEFAGKTSSRLTRARRITLSRLSSNSCAWAPSARATTCTSRPGGTPFSARTFRIALMISIRSDIRSSALTSRSFFSAAGQGATMMLSPVWGSCLPDLLGDEGHVGMEQLQGGLQHVATARLRRASAGLARPWPYSRGLTSSMYQSHSSLHMNS